MARELVQAPDGIPLTNHHVQQLIASWMGLDGDGSDAQLWGVPLRQTAVKDATAYASDIRNRGTGGLHERITHSSGAPVLLDITDAGITFGGTVTGLFAVGMIVDWDSAATPPTGWSICDGTGGTPDLRDRFLVGAGSTYARGTSGGAATVNLLHHHTSAAHSHAHATTHVHTLNGHVHGMQNHTHQNSHNHNITNHTHSISTASGQTLGDGAFSSTDKTGSSTAFDNNDTGHTHGLNHAHGGATGSDGTSPTGGSNTATSGGPSNNTSNSNSDDTTAVAPGTSDATTPADSGDSLSTTQSLLPPYYATYKIRRMVA